MANDSLEEQIARLMQQLDQLQTIGQTVANLAGEPTPIPVRTTQSASSNSSGGGIGSTLLSVFGEGLGLNLLIAGITSLFEGGSDRNTPPPLTKFALPSSISVNAGVSESAPVRAFAVDSAQGGVSRPVMSADVSQVTVPDQAIDRQWFLDHSNDIALAVRQAMLESSVLNDVIREV